MSKKCTRTLASVALISLVIFASSSVNNSAYAAAGRVTRISGADRYETASQVATTNWSYGTDNVVLVSGEGYADAVSASSLAKQLNAPILLTNSKTLNYNAKSALDTLKPKNIYIVGGNASISKGVRTTLSNYGYNLIELQGANRYETNAAVAKKMVELGVSAENVLLASGEGFSDALSVAPVAATKGQILLLGCNDSSEMQSVINFVRTNNSKVTVVGTSNVISNYIYDLLNAVDRVNGGASRFETNINVLNKYDSSLESDKLFIANASGDGYADALVASGLAGKTASPLVLVDKYGSDATNNALSYIKSKSTVATDLNVIGGSGVVSESTVYDINNIISQKGSSNSNNSRTVSSIEAVSLNQMKIHFNTSLDEDSAEDVENYEIDGAELTGLDDDGAAKDENGARVKLIDDNTVLITFAHPFRQYAKVTVNVKKGILTKDKEDSIDGFEQDVTFSDTTAPTLKRVSVEGNSQITVEFSEAVNMKSINELKNKFKIDGRSLGNYGVSSDYSEIKDGIKVTNSSYGKTGTWANKVTFYLDSPIDSGNHTLNISDGDYDNDNGILSDVAGFPFEETSEDFEVDDMSTQPVVRYVEETSSGEVHIKFDRSMDIATVKNLSYYEINDEKLSSISGASIETDDDDTLIKLKHINDGTIHTGANTIYISDRIKDAYGNKVDEDTRKSFDHVRDDTRPEVLDVSIIDSETIRVRFSKDVDYYYATNISNYKLEDSKDVDITDHIEGIYSTSGESDTGNTSTYNIKLKRYDPDNPDDDWRLNGSRYTLTIEDIIDTESTPNVMEDYSTTLNGNDDVAPRGVGIYARQGDDSDSDRDRVVIYFSEPMDVSTITDKDNYKYLNGEGETKTLPSDAEISAGEDDKSAIIEFPSSYHVRTTGRTTYGSSNDVVAVTVFDVKDDAGNLLDTVAYNNGNKIDIAESGAKVKAKTLKIYYDGDDLKADVQFTRAVEYITPSDFTLGGITPSTATISGDKVILIFKEGAEATSDEKAAHPLIYANGKVNENPTKIELLKAQGQNAKLNIVSTGTTDEIGARVSRDENGNVIDLSDDQDEIYNYDAAPRTTCSDDSDPDYWTATTDSDGAKVYITFDTPLDPGSGIDTDDFTFAGSDGTNIKADSVKVDGTTLIFSFNKDNKNFKAFKGSTLDIRVSSSSSLRTYKDEDGDYAEYEPSSDDLRKRTVTIGQANTPDPGTVTATIEQAGTAIVGKTVVVASLPAGIDATKYDVAVNGTVLTYNAATGKFIATLDGIYTVADLQAKTTVTAKAAGTFVGTLQGATLVDAVGAGNNGKTQFSLNGVTKLNASDTFKYMISTTGSAVSTPKVGDNLSSWTSVVDGDIVSAANGTHIGIAEVDSNGTVVRFVDTTAVSISQIDSLQGATLVDAVGSGNNGKTQFSLSGVTKLNASDTFKYMISTTGSAVPTPKVGDNLLSWTSVVDGDTVSVANGTHIGIAEVDSNGTVVRFVDLPAVSISQVDTLQGAALVDAIGYGNNGKTQFSLSGVTKLNASDTFKYMISTTGSAVPTPNAGDKLSSWIPVVDGSTVSVYNGTHIGIAEVDANGTVVKFVDLPAVVKDYIAATPAKVTATNVSYITTTLTSSGSIIVKVDGTDEAHTFTLSLDSKTFFSNVYSLGTALGSSVNSSSVALNKVADVTVVGGKIVITSKSAGLSSSVTVTITGTNQSDIVKLTGFTGTETGSGTAEAN